MKAVETLIHARWVLPIAPNHLVLQNHSVALDQGKIVALLPTQETTTFQATTVHHLQENHLLMPGLINAHTHSPMVCLRGIADDLPLMTWLHQYIWPLETALMSHDYILDGSTLAIAEMIRGGTTTFNENYFWGHLAAEAAQKTGIRARIGLLVMDVPTLYAKNEAACLDYVHTVLATTPPSARIRWALAPGHPFTVSNAGFEEIIGLAGKHHLPIHLHLHETRAEVEDSLRIHGHRPLERLRRLGLLEQHLMAVHMTQLEEDEIAILAAASKQVHIVHCVESNMKLASGICPIQRLVDSGINVALGTDGAASNNDIDLWSEMRTASLQAKSYYQEATAFNAPTALYAATMGGAKALGWEKEIGSIEPGKAADLIAIDFDALCTRPIYNPMTHLIYALQQHQVSDVWVAGKPLLAQKQFTTLDLDALKAMAQKWGERVRGAVASQKGVRHC